MALTKVQRDIVKLVKTKVLINKTQLELYTACADIDLALRELCELNRLKKIVVSVICPDIPIASVEVLYCVPQVAEVSVTYTNKML